MTKGLGARCEHVRVATMAKQLTSAVRNKDLRRGTEHLQDVEAYLLINETDILAEEKKMKKHWYAVYFWQTFNSGKFSLE